MTTNQKLDQLKTSSVVIIIDRLPPQPSLSFISQFPFLISRMQLTIYEKPNRLIAQVMWMAVCATKKRLLVTHFVVVVLCRRPDPVLQQKKKKTKKNFVYPMHGQWWGEVWRGDEIRKSHGLPAINRFVGNSKFAQKHNICCCCRHLCATWTCGLIVNRKLYYIALTIIYKYDACSHVMFELKTINPQAVNKQTIGHASVCIAFVYNNNFERKDKMCA